MQVGQIKENGEGLAWGKVFAQNFRGEVKLVPQQSNNEKAPTHTVWLKEANAVDACVVGNAWRSESKATPGTYNYRIQHIDVSTNKLTWFKCFQREPGEYQVVYLRDDNQADSQAA